MGRVWILIGVLVAAACGASSSVSTEQPSQPTDAGGSTAPTGGADDAVIEVFADSEIGSMLRDEALQSWSAAPEVQLEAGTSERWQVVMDPPQSDEVDGIAAALGVNGAVTVVDDPTPGAGLSVIADNPEGEWLLVHSQSQPWWVYQRDTLHAREQTLPCPTLPFDHPQGGQCVDGQPPPAAPANEAAVADAVVRVMSAVGVAPDDYRSEVFVFDDVVDVTVEFTPRGRRSDVRWALTVSSGGEILAGSGPLRPPERVDDVGTVGLDEALRRLGREGSTTNPEITSIEPALMTVWDVDGRAWLVPAAVLSGGGFFTTVSVINARHIRVVDTPEAEIPPPGDGSLPPALGTLPPVPQAPPSTTTLVPMLPLPATPTGPPVAGSMPSDPPPTLPVPPLGPSLPDDVRAHYTEVMSRQLAGEPLESAVAQLGAAGWTVRTDDLDDPTESFTADLLADRVMIEHRDGAVVRVVVG
ncbi:MAG: hypothetical protein AAFY28_00355 [Actinomycetota bacterium]